MNTLKQPNRAEILRRALSDGDWATREVIFQRSNRYFLTNNAAAELRDRGFIVEQRRVKQQHEYRVLSATASASV